MRVATSAAHAFAVVVWGSTGSPSASVRGLGAYYLGREISYLARPIGIGL